MQEQQRGAGGQSTVGRTLVVVRETIVFRVVVVEQFLLIAMSVDAVVVLDNGENYVHRLLMLKLIFVLD